MYHRPMRIAVAVAIAAATIAAAAPQDHRENGARDMMLSLGTGLKGEALREAIAKAEAHPLGTSANPVRENSPDGERAYLRRLRCADGAAPGFERAGSVGTGPYGFILDLYKVQCKDQPPVDLYMDMYHDGPENRPVPGFTITS